MQPALKIVSADSLDLHLRVADPEVLAELLRRPPEEREAFALAALKVGVLALKQAAGALDERALRDAGKELLGGIQQAVGDRMAKTSADIASELKRYFDTSTGTVPQAIERLVRGGGELDLLLTRHLGADTSTLARTLTQHVGEQSPLLRALSPEQKSGLLARVEDLVKTSLESQRTEVLGAFDLNREDSALSRLIRAVRDGQGSLEKNFNETIVKVQREWSLDVEGSALARFRKGLTDLIEKQVKEQAEFRASVMKELEGLRARRDVEQATTRKGEKFEEALGRLLQADAARSNEVFAAVGLRTGALRNCKKGDFTLEFGPESAAPGEAIVVEAKDDAEYGTRGALEELAEARANRRAQAGVFVLSKGVAAAGMPRFQRHGPDVVVVWDAEDPSTDLWVLAALEVARALIVRRAREGEEKREGLQELETAVAQLEKDALILDAILTQTNTIEGGVSKIREEAARLKKKIERGLAEMKEGLGALKPQGGPQ
jgi:hypothetical protein